MTGFKKFLKFIGWSLFTAASGVLFLVSSFFLYLTPNLPNVDQLKDVQFQIPLRIYSADDKLISEFGEKRRTPIHIKDVPQNFINAFISAEDNRFFTHDGVDIKGLMRAAMQLVTTGHIQSGGSTITMQVAKNFLLSRERTFTRKFNEILLALQIDRELTKKEILELYFNKIYLGNRAYGIEAASQVYYGKHMNELTLSQIAMIAGLPKAPSRYNPIADPARALERRNWILKRLFQLGYIKHDAWARATKMPVTASYHGAITQLYAPYIAEMARDKIIKKYGQSAYTRGIKVYLTIKSTLQTTAINALQKGLESYDKRHGYRGPEQKIPLNILNSQKKLQDLLKQTPIIANQIPAIVLSVDSKVAKLEINDSKQINLTLDNAHWARTYKTVNRVSAPPQSLNEILSPDNLIRVKNENGIWKLTQLPEVEGALVSITPKTGAILALVGGYDFTKSKYNRVTQAKRQPGSNIKPFIYLAALDKGFTAASIFNDAPVVFQDPTLETAWRPENSGGHFAGPTRLRVALYTSRNLVSIRLLKATGINDTIEFMKRFGFNPDQLPHNLTLALGSAILTPLQIARGYSIIANGGYKIKPYFIDKVIDGDGKILYAHPIPQICNPVCPKGSSLVIDKTPLLKPVIDPREIFIMHSILKDVIRKGTGRRARILKRPDLAGKTGTTNDQKDAWFSGFNQNIETTVWVGFDQPKTLGRHEYGATAALPIWINYMKVALKNMPLASMKQPNGIVSVRINPRTGKRTYIGNPKAIFEYFRKEHIPSIEKSPENNPQNMGQGQQRPSSVDEQLFQ